MNIKKLFKSKEVNYSHIFYTEKKPSLIQRIEQKLINNTFLNTMVISISLIGAGISLGISTYGLISIMGILFEPYLGADIVTLILYLIGLGVGLKSILRLIDYRKIPRQEKNKSYFLKTFLLFALAGLIITLPSFLSVSGGGGIFGQGSTMWGNTTIQKWIVDTNLSKNL